MELRAETAPLRFSCAEPFGCLHRTEPGRVEAAEARKGW